MRRGSFGGKGEIRIPTDKLQGFLFAGEEGRADPGLAKTLKNGRDQDEAAILQETGRPDASSK